MAEIQQTQRGGRDRTRLRKAQLRVDFTPMVDMNMLLITFFMLATSLFTPQSMKITMPTNKGEGTDVPNSKAVTVYLGNDHKIFYFEGLPNLQKPNFLTQTNFTAEGLRELLNKRNSAINSRINELKQKKANSLISKTQYNKEVTELKDKSPVVIIKPLDNSTYNDMVATLDEMLITNISKYMVTKLDANDVKMLKNSNVEFERR